MHQRIIDAISRIRQGVGVHLSAGLINQICTSVERFWRECVLYPATVVHVYILQALHGNKALSNLRHLSKLELTAQSFCAGTAQEGASNCCNHVRRLKDRPERVPCDGFLARYTQGLTLIVSAQRLRFVRHPQFSEAVSWSRCTSPQLSSTFRNTAGR